MEGESENGMPAWVRRKVVPTTNERVRSVHLLKEGGMRKSAIVFTDAHAFVAEKSAMAGVKVYDVTYPPGLLVNGSKCPHCGKPIREPVRKVATLVKAGKKAEAGSRLSRRQAAHRKDAARKPRRALGSRKSR